MKEMTKVEKRFIKSCNWYVLLHDFNNDKIIRWNIFESSKFSEAVVELLREYKSLENFIASLDSIAMWCFWGQVEYEIFVKGVICKNNNVNKISVYEQLELNIGILAKYIIDQWNKRPYVRNKIEY